MQYGRKKKAYRIKGLSYKQQQFADIYLTNNHNAKQAATTVGYNPNNAASRLKSKAMKEYIENKISYVREKSSLTVDYKVDKLRHVIETGIPTGKKTLNPEMVRLSLTAIAEHNKMAGDYAPEKKANLNLNVDVDNKILSVAKDVIKDY
jgi:phage terminase small subunit